MKNDSEVQKLLNKVKAVEKGENLDLSSDEDLSIAVMNLISIEEHLFFSGGKTGDKNTAVVRSSAKRFVLGCFFIILYSRQMDNSESWNDYIF